MSGPNGGFNTGWDASNPFGSIPGTMPSATEHFEVTSSETPTTPEEAVSPYESPPTTPTTAPSPSPVGPSPSESPRPVSTAPGVPGVVEGTVPYVETPPEGGLVAPEGAVVNGGAEPGPGWTEESGIPGPMIDTGVPYTSKKKASTGTIVLGVGAGLAALGGLVYLIAKRRD